MSSFPDDCHYTKDHEWIRVKGPVGTVGITDYAQESLGDVVYAELPKVGDTFEAHEAFGSVESVKAVSELFIPVSGVVTEVNEALADSPEFINSDPYHKGWMIKLKLTHTGEVDALLTAAEYEDYVAEEKGE